MLLLITFKINFSKVFILPMFGAFFPMGGFILHQVKSCCDAALRVAEFCSGLGVSTAGLEGWQEPVEFLLLLLTTSSASSCFHDFFEPRQPQSYPMVCVKVDCEGTSNFPVSQMCVPREFPSEDTLQSVSSLLHKVILSKLSSMGGLCRLDPEVICAL